MNPSPHGSGGPRRWLAHPWLSAFVAAAWLLLHGSLAPVHWLWAALMGLVLPWLAHDFIDAPPGPVRAFAAIARLALRVLWDIVVANVAVARLVLSPRRQPQPAWVLVEHPLQDPRAVALLATIITMTPGTVSCVVDEARQRIHVHALDTTDAQAVAADIVQRYALPLKEIFG